MGGLGLAKKDGGLGEGGGALGEPFPTASAIPIALSGEVGGLDQRIVEAPWALRCGAIGGWGGLVHMSLFGPVYANYKRLCFRLWRKEVILAQALGDGREVEDEWRHVVRTFVLSGPVGSGASSQCQGQ